MIAGLAIAVLFGLTKPAAAETVTYTLAGDATGAYQDLTSGSTAQSFSNVAVAIVLEGQTPAIVLPGKGAGLLLTKGAIFGGGAAGVIPLGANSAFAVGAGANAGMAAFGGYDPITEQFGSSIQFAGVGLDGFDGVSKLGPIAVTIDKFPSSFDAISGGDTYVLDFSSFDNAQFSAAVPEPSTWAMLILGLGGVGAALRQKKVAAGA